ncbi:MAG: alpha-galactosidase, partial [Bacteroidales bacterium]|nr:alpha-galactosidase [Bacteroidales bacterium]
MKRIRLIFTLMALLPVMTAQAQAPLARKNIENPDKWINSVFAKGTIPPFSFELDGVPSEKFIKGWEYEKKKVTAKEPGSICYEISYKEKKSGLKVIATVTGYNDFAAVEWVLRFENTGSGNTGQIGNVKTADFILRE